MVQRAEPQHAQRDPGVDDQAGGRAGGTVAPADDHGIDPAGLGVSDGGLDRPTQFGARHRAHVGLDAMPGERLFEAGHHPVGAQAEHGPAAGVQDRADPHECPFAPADRGRLLLPEADAWLKRKERQVSLAQAAVLRGTVVTR